MNDVRGGGEGEAMMALARELYPVCRSVTGDGLRETLRLIGGRVPLTLHEVPSGTQVLDWTVPNEWNIRDAYVKNTRGERVIDFQEHNLHVLNYSAPVHARMSLESLKPHLHSLPEQPEWIPYRTSYYQETWGFCLSHQALSALEEGEYEVVIDSTLEPGHLSYGEVLLPGESEDEVLVSTHCCHPSLANDNLSGIAVTTFLARALSQLKDRRYSYRFLFIPGTIGAITWLGLNEARTDKIKHGWVISGVGDSGPLSYKRSRRGDAEVDRAAVQVLEESLVAEREHPHIFDFSPYGYDERQYNSPGFDLPVGRLSRTPYGSYPEYHTSADNLSFISGAALAGALEVCLDLVKRLEQNRTYRNLFPKGEPQLGKRGLYSSLGGHQDAGDLRLALLWVLNLSDGEHTLLDIAERSGLPFRAVHEASGLLHEHGLLQDLRENL